MDLTSLPISSNYYGAYSGWRYAFFGSKHAACYNVRNMPISYVLHVIFCKFVRVMAYTLSYSPLVRGILIIIGLSSEKKVIWSYTKPNITIVKNPKPVGDLAMMQDPRGSVRRFLSVSSSTDFDGSVPVRHRPSSPNPTPITYGHLGPKSFSKRDGKSLRKRGVLCNVWSCHNQVMFDCVFAPRRFAGDAGAFLSIQ